ncbi:MAG TPA: hypothetical protein V6D17_18740 [Candidatus Obscuribacterales bacterium]
MPFKYAFLLIVFGAAVIIGLSLTYPTITEDIEKATELNQRRQEEGNLIDKLAERQKIQRQQQALESDISALRHAVPSRPNLELAILDMEKMADEAGVDIISFELPGMDTEKASEKEIVDLLHESGSTASLGSKTMASRQTEGHKSTTEPSDIGSTLGLKRLKKDVYVTGQYANLIDFLNKLESYERVMGMSQVIVAMPIADRKGDQDKASDKGRKLKLTQPVMTFLLSVYYLP